MIGLHEVTNITLNVANLTKMTQFYTEVLV